jgi:hypothetical protein
MLSAKPVYDSEENFRVIGTIFAGSNAYKGKKLTSPTHSTVERREAAQP